MVTNLCTMECQLKFHCRSTGLSRKKIMGHGRCRGQNASGMSVRLKTKIGTPGAIGLMERRPRIDSQ